MCICVFYWPSRFSMYVIQAELKSGDHVMCFSYIHDILTLLSE
jgi:hypothetical protein